MARATYEVRSGADAEPDAEPDPTPTPTPTPTPPAHTVADTDRPPRPSPPPSTATPTTAKQYPTPGSDTDHPQRPRESVDVRESSDPAGPSTSPPDRRGRRRRAHQPVRTHPILVPRFPHPTRGNAFVPALAAESRPECGTIRTGRARHEPAPAICWFSLGLTAEIFNSTMTPTGTRSRAGGRV